MLSLPAVELGVSHSLAGFQAPSRVNACLLQCVTRGLVESGESSR